MALQPQCVAAKVCCCRFWSNLRRQSKNRLISTQLQSKDMLVLALTNGIVAITAMHNHMGNVAEYLVNPMCVCQG